jgi:hypothetical protein
MTQFVAVDKTTNRVLFGVGRPDAPNLEGPMNAPPPDEDNIVYYAWQGDLRLSDGPTPNAVLEWQDKPVWVVGLADHIAFGLTAIDAAAEKARLVVIEQQTNVPEYLRTEPQARAFKAAGYPEDDVPPCVASWAKAKWRDGWTAQQAADNIVATADRWNGLMDAIRELRLCAKEDVRHATSSPEVSAHIEQFISNLNNLMEGAV